MGLDMYLYRKGGNAKMSEDMTLDQYFELRDEIQVAYWRKANAIHAWFVDNIQGGVDNCEAYPVNLEQLAGLVQTCQQILDGEANPKELLPARGGFFFGDTSMGDWYLQDLENTIKQLEPLLSSEAIERGDTEYEYLASW